MIKPRYSHIFSKCEDGAERAEMANQIWGELSKVLQELGTYSDTNKRLLDRLVREYVEYEMEYPNVVAQGAVAISEVTGGQYFSYAWSALNKTKENILKLETALKFTIDKAVTAQKPVGKKLSSDKWLDDLQN